MTRELDDAIYDRLREKGWPDDDQFADVKADEVAQLCAALSYDLPFLNGRRHLGLCTSRTVTAWALGRGAVLEQHPVVRGMYRLAFCYQDQAYEFDLGSEVLR